MKKLAIIIFVTVVPMLLFTVLAVWLILPWASPKPLTYDDTVCIEFLRNNMPLFNDYAVGKSPGNIRMIEFQYSKVTGDGFEVLKPLSNLEELNCIHAKSLNDSFTVCLKYFPKLKRLILCDTDTTSASIPEIAKLANLESLRLDVKARKEGEVPFSDADLERLTACKKLAHLYVGGACTVSDAGLRHLEQLPDLKYLGLSTGNITDMGIDYLKTLPRIEEINIGVGSGTTPRRIVNGKQLIFVR